MSIKHIITMITGICLCCSLYAQQNMSENYRMTVTLGGLAEGGLRSFIIQVDEKNDNVWKMTSKAKVTTGRNLDMAQIKTDSMYSSRILEDVLKDSLAKNMYVLAVNSFMDQMDGILKTEGVTVNDQISYDGGTGYFTVTIKAGKEDTYAMIRAFSADRTQLMIYYKKLKPFAGNYLDIGSRSVKNGDYIIYVKTPAQEFSGRVTKN